jgi:hypothetical protein
MKPGTKFILVSVMLVVGTAFYFTPYYALPPLSQTTVPRPSREGTLRFPPYPILICLSSRTTPRWVLLHAAVAGSR